MKDGFANHSIIKCELKGEVRKVSEKNLTVKDFGCPEALGGVYRRVTLKLR